MEDAHVSTGSAQAAAFYVEALREGAVWTIRDEAGFPAPMNSDGVRSHPFWSLRSRVDRVVEHVAAYTGFTPTQIPLDVFRKRWLPGMARDGLHVGLNWSGEHATGYDLAADEVERNLAAHDA